MRGLGWGIIAAMPKKRDVLEQLKRDELVAAVEQFELEVEDRRVRDQLLDVLASSRKAALSAVLEPLSRDRLKELCRALGLDDSGRAKSDLVMRLAGNTAVAKSAPPRSASEAPKANGKADPIARAAAVAEVASKAAAEGRLTTQQLEGYLWSAADILRGSIDSSDYKNFIFGLMFLKRLSDRFEEECEQLVADGHDPNDEDEHQFWVPKSARWATIQKTAEAVGEALNRACAALEEKNNSLEGVLAGVDYNDERKLGDAKQRDQVLLKLVQHFSKVNLRNSNLSEPDMLGRAYEYLIEKFADDAGKKGGEFYTPNMVVKLLVELLQPVEGMRICDPTCGSGGMLIQCAGYVERHGGNRRNLSLYGQEKNLGTWAICKMNMLLHGFPSERIEKGDTIRDPKLVQDGELMLFDRVIANPPFSLDNWGRETAENDGYGRFRFGVPPKTKGDLAFVQHMISTLNNTGRMGVVMPHGVLFRGSAEGEIRKRILQEDLVEAVVGLPSNLFYGTGIPAAILIVNRAKAKDRKGKVLFIEASREFKEGSNQNHLRPQDVEKIANTAAAFKDVERYARIVPIKEIEKNEFNLNISRYVETAEAVEKIDVASAVAKLREAEQARDETKVTMDGFLSELGLN